MSDPGDLPRLSQAPSSPLGGLMAAATKDVPTDAQIAGLAERLTVALGPEQAAAVSRGSWTWLKLGVATGVAAAMIAGAFAVREHSASHAAPRAPESASAPTAVNPTASESAAVTASAALSAAPAASAAAENGSVAHSSPVAKSGTSSSKVSGAATDGASEARLLEQARGFLQSAPARALGLTNQHAALFPHGLLAQEREVIAIEALRRLNRATEADRRAAAFGKAFPGSAHQRVVEDPAVK